MSNSPDNQKTTATPEVTGLGTVTVDGKTVYDTADTFTEGVDTVINEIHTAATSATKTAENTAQQATQEASRSYNSHSNHSSPKSSHYPKEGSGTESFADYGKHLNKWGIWVGVILVTLGTLIFLDMLSGTIPALENLFGGYSFWRFWPLLIVFGGLAIAFSPTKETPDPRIKNRLSLLRFSEGMFVGTIGLVLLGNSLALVSWLSWPAMLSFWPLLLVIIGLSVLSYGMKTQWFSVLAYALSIVTLVAVASSMWLGQAPLVEPFATLAEFGSFRGMDLFNIGSMFEASWH